MSNERSTDLRARLTSDLLTIFVEYGGEVGTDEKAMLDEMVDAAMGTVDPLLDQIAMLAEEIDVHVAARDTSIPTGYNSTDSHEWLGTER